MQTIVCERRRLVHFDRFGAQFIKHSIGRGPVQYNQTGSAIYSIFEEEDRFAETQVKPLARSRSGRVGHPAVILTKGIGMALVTGGTTSALGGPLIYVVVYQQGIRGVAYNSDDTRAYVLSFGANDVTAFSLIPLKRLKYIPVGFGSRDTSVLPGDDQVLVVSENRVKVFDAESYETVYEIEDISPVHYDRQSAHLYYTDEQGLHLFDIPAGKSKVSYPTLGNAVAVLGPK